MKTITIAGNIGRDAEVRRTQSGDAVTSWSVAVEDRTQKEKSTIWFKCTLWGKRGETLAQYLTKGGRVAVSGELGLEVYEGKTYLTIRADQVTLLGGGERRDEDRQDRPDHNAIGSSAGERARSSTRADLDDEIPF
jgi:single-strand DNA-binding protein